jgi:hypothetical protein
MRRFLVAPLTGALLFSTACAASAQWGNSRPSYGGVPYAEARRAAYDNGFREGVRDGETDGRRRDRFEYRDERDFQRADLGYHRSFGDVERYRQSFRAGFVDGYSQGYRRYDRSPGNYGTYPYGGGSYGGYGRERGSYSIAFDNGARDGYEKGREDARDNDAFDARRHKWYREGDRHYEGRYGSRDQYKDEYRRGFLAGYDQGYRSYR